MSRTLIWPTTLKYQQVTNGREAQTIHKRAPTAYVPIVSIPQISDADWNRLAASMYDTKEEHDG